MARSTGSLEGLLARVAPVADRVGKADFYPALLSALAAHLKADLPMSKVSRAIIDGETEGMMRILVDADSEEILGACFFGMHGDDLAQQIGLAMQAGIGYKAVRDALPIHPSVAEFIPTLLGSLQRLE